MNVPRPIVILGAARSGTKILRDSLASATGAGAVPFDIGFVWRYGIRGSTDDALDPRGLTPRQRLFIRRYIERFAAGTPSTVIEKTVGNTLRVPYVSSVLPDAFFIHLVRDGVDVVESTYRQWHEPTDSTYLREKLRHFPLRMLPGYGARYARSLARRRLARDGRVGTWGVRYPGIDDDLREVDLIRVCARQWRQSVTVASRDVRLSDQPVMTVRYEDLIAQPRAELEAVAAFCGLPTPEVTLENAARRIRKGRSGAGTAALTSAQLAAIDEEMADALIQQGYATANSDSRQAGGVG